MFLTTTIAFVFNMKLMWIEIYHAASHLCIKFSICPQQLMLCHRPLLNLLSLLFSKKWTVHCTLFPIEQIICNWIQIVPSCQLWSRSKFPLKVSTVCSRLLLLHAQRMLIKNSNRNHLFKLSMIWISILILYKKILSK